MPEPGGEPGVAITNYSGWQVSNAQQDCTSSGVNLVVVEGGTPRAVTPGDMSSHIANNAEDSEAGTMRYVGGDIGVILVPIEPQQGS